MTHVIHVIAARLRGEEGQGLVEYVVLIALIALTLFAALLFFSDQVGKVFTRSRTSSTTRCRTSEARGRGFTHPETLRARGRSRGEVLRFGVCPRT